MNENLAFVAETLETAEVINSLVRTNLRDGGFLLAEFRNFGGHAGENAAAKLFKAAPKLLTELENIASANWREWDEEVRSPHEFVKWAQSRARSAIRAATE